jgi:outer membrane protein
MYLPVRAIATSAGVFVASIAVPLAAQDAPQQVAYVDTRKILDQAPGRTEAEAVLQKEFAALEAQLKQMNDAVIKAFGDYQGLPVTATQAEKDRRLKLVQDGQTALQQKQREFDAQAAARRSEVLQPFLDLIKIALEDLRVEGRWTYILEGGQGSAIVAADKNLDITDRAIAKVRMMPKPLIAPGAATKKPDSTLTKKPG